eukprot:362411-Chlamydomonas_euryale.AAC.4
MGGWGVESVGTKTEGWGLAAGWRVGRIGTKMDGCGLEAAKPPIYTAQCLHAHTHTHTHTTPHGSCCMRRLQGLCQAPEAQRPGDPPSLALWRAAAAAACPPPCRPCRGAQSWGTTGGVARSHGAPQVGWHNLDS